MKVKKLSFVGVLQKFSSSRWKTLANGQKLRLAFNSTATYQLMNHTQERQFAIMLKSRDNRSFLKYFIFYLEEFLNSFKAIDGVYEGLAEGHKCSTQCSEHYTRFYDPFYDEWVTVSGFNQKFEFFKNWKCLETFHRQTRASSWNLMCVWSLWSRQRMANGL